MSTPSDAVHTVLGAGPAGSTLAGELARRGHPVRLAARGDGDAAQGVTRVRSDVSTVEGALAAIEGSEVVYHCVNTAYHLQVETMPTIQQAVLEAVETTGARLVVLDTLYPYGETHGQVMTEQTPWRATTAKGAMRAQLDETYLTAHQQGRARVTLGRSADFVGPGVLNSTLGGAVFPGALTGGEVTGLGDIDLPHSYTNIADVAAGLATLGEHPEGDGHVWHLPTAPAETTRTIHGMLEQRVGQPLNTVVLEEARPFGPFDQVFMDSYAELFYQHTEPQVMDSSAFEQRFAVWPAALGDTLDMTLDWYRTWLAAQRG